MSPIVGIGVVGSKVGEAIITQSADPNTQSLEAVAGRDTVDLVGGSDLIAGHVADDGAAGVLDRNTSLGAGINAGRDGIDESLVFGVGGRSGAVVVIALEGEEILVDGSGQALVKDSQEASIIIVFSIREDGIGVGSAIEGVVANELQVIMTIGGGTCSMGIDHACVPVHRVHPFCKWNKVLVIEREGED